MIGQILGNYRVIDQLSVGGMGTVYRAEHALIGRIVAVKVLNPELCTNKDVVNRFFNEAKATTAIKHPGIVEIFDFGYMPSGLAYIVMEFLDGMTLSQRMKLRGPIPEGEAAMILRGVCSALAAAHGKGIVHRDLKPDNIFVLPDPDSPLGERCKLLDFGIAKLTDIGPAGSATKTGAVMGTPTYMSPEQCRGSGDVDHRADLYSLGCIFYELLTGRPPFINPGAGELIGSHLFVQPEPPSRHTTVALLPETETLVMSLLDKEPARRVQTARDLGAYLTQIAQRFGWTPSATDPDVRISMQHMSLATAQPPHTPIFTPANTPPPLAPYLKPTTLSGSASEMPRTPAPRGSRRGLWVGLGGGVVIAGVIAAVGLTGAGRSAAGQPTAPIMAPTTEVARPAEVAPRPPTEVVKPTVPVEVAKPEVAKPEVATPADVAKPAVVTKPSKPTRPTKPAKPGKSPSADLLETDI